MKMNEAQRNAFKNLSGLVYEDLLRKGYLGNSKVSNSSLQPIYDVLEPIINIRYNTFVKKVNLTIMKINYNKFKEKYFKTNKEDVKPSVQQVEAYRPGPKTKKMHYIQGLLEDGCSWGTIIEQYNEKYGTKYNVSDLRRNYLMWDANRFKTTKKLSSVSAERLNLIREGIKEGVSYSSLCIRHGLSVATIIKIKKEMEK